MKRILTFLTLAVVMIALPMSGVYASQSYPVSGDTIINSLNVLDVKFAGKNVIWTMEITETWTGDIYGPSAPLISTWKVHNYDPTTLGPPFFGFGPNSPGIIHEQLTLVGATFQDKTGDLTIEFNLQLQNMSGHWTILNGTDGLKNLHGGGTLGVMPDTYEGYVHFDP